MSELTELEHEDGLEDAYFSGVEVGMEVAPEVSVVEELRAEVERLRAERDALREALGEAIDAMEAHDWGERDGDCTILFASEIDNLRVALAAVPAPASGLDAAQQRIAALERQHEADAAQIASLRRALEVANEAVDEALEAAFG